MPDLKISMMYLWTELIQAGDTVKCWDCPGLKNDGFFHCLIVYPVKPKQLTEFLNGNENADYCRMWKTYSEFSKEALKQTEGCERFEPQN